MQFASAPIMVYCEMQFGLLSARFTRWARNWLNKLEWHAMDPFAGKKAAILVTDGFEQMKLTEPQKALERAGAQTRIVPTAPGKAKTWKYTDWGKSLPVDIPLPETKPEAFDALLLPGRGVESG